MKIKMLLLIISLILAACGKAEPTVVDNGNPGQIKVIVFLDTNANKVMDAGEKGVSDQILISQGSPCPSGTNDFTTATTDANGEYTFKDLKPGLYCVGYYGIKSTTTRLAVKVYLSSDETKRVVYGLIVD